MFDGKDRGLVQAWTTHVGICAGDLDDDGDTNLSDFGILAGNMGKNNLPSPPHHADAVRIIGATKIPPWSS